MTQPLVIVAAVNGGMQRSRDGAFVPETPEEIAEDARLCREAGAAIVHVHARDDEGRNTGDIEVYADREDDLNALFAQLAAEDEGADDELPPIIVDTGFGEDWEWAA